MRRRHAPERRASHETSGLKYPTAVSCDRACEQVSARIQRSRNLLENEWNPACENAASVDRPKIDTCRRFVLAREQRYVGIARIQGTVEQSLHARFVEHQKR